MRRMKTKRVWLNKSVLSMCMAMLLLCSIYNPTYAAVTFDKNFNSNVLPSNPGSGANEWQIMRGGYVGAYDRSDVSKGFDAKSNATYSDDDAVRLTKNVVSTNKENEFLMYLNVEPQVSWEEILQLNTLVVTNANKGVDPPGWPTAGQPSTLRPEKSGNYSTPVQIEYYAMENGKKIVLAKVTMYADTPEVPQGAYGVGNPLLGPADGTFSAGNNFNLKENGNSGVSTAQIDISETYHKYDFPIQKVYPKTVKDQMGDHILMDSSSLNYDGGSCSYQNDVIDWKLPEKDLGLLPYEINGKGHIVPVGVCRSLENGKVTYYREAAYQLSYKFTLTVEDSDFISCSSANSSNDISSEYAVQTNRSPDSPSDKDRGGSVTYKAGNVTGTGYFKSPYIKGLLYNLEFQKVIEGSRVHLDGVTFTIERTVSGSNHVDQVQFKDTKVSGADGWLKFRNMPWGEYTITEVAYKTGDKIQSDYIEQDLPKKVATVQIGQVVNGSALTSDHESKHSCDAAGDTKNQLFVLNGGIVKNKPYRAKITIQKTVNSYENLPGELKAATYTMQATSDDSYIKPGESDSKLKFLDEEDAIAHKQKVSYELIVPKDGGTIELQEVIPNKVKSKVVFGNIDITGNTGSYKEENQGCSLKVLPGDDITITVTNVPVGKLYIKKVIDNYCKELENDTFIVEAVSAENAGSSINTEVALQHNETSSVIRVTKQTKINITEILPKEYTLSNLTIGSEGSLSGNCVTVNPGEEVTVTVHNKYGNKPFFHVSDAVKNLFKGQ